MRALAIHDIPYAAFQPSTLNLLAVIGAHIGDLLMRNAHAIAPDWAEEDFMSALRRSIGGLSAMRATGRFDRLQVGSCDGRWSDSRDAHEQSRNRSYLYV